MLGKRIEQYQIEALIGEGAQAGVYLAVHASLGSVHALKVPWLASDEARAALLREGRAQAAVRHPNLVDVTDVIGGEVPALVLEYVTGPTLEAWLGRACDGASLASRLEVFRGIVEGVDAIHRAGAIHADLKPANVLLAPTSEGWQPKITDFGVARRAVPRADDHPPSPCSGTGGYMSPEQVLGEQIDARADLFALGCLLFELVTGRPAFPVTDPITQARATLGGVPQRTLRPIPEALRAVVKGLLEPDVTVRTGSCQALTEQLDAAIDATLSLDDRLATPRPPKPRRWRLPLELAAVIGVVAGMSLGVGMLSVVGPAVAEAPAPITTAAPAPVEAVAAAVVAAPPPEVQRVAVARVPTPPPAPQPVARPGRVVVEGDGVVSLRGADGRWTAAGQVAPGAYRFRSRFGGVEGPEGSLSVGPGETVVVRCASFAMRCVTR